MRLLVLAHRGGDRSTDWLARRLDDVDADPAHVEVREDLRLDLVVELGMLGEARLRVLAALPDPLATEREPRATLVDDVRLGGEVDEIAFARDSLTVEDVELDLLERRRHLVLHNLHARAVADH